MEMVGKLMSQTSSSLGMTEELKEARDNRVMAEAWVVMNKSGFRWKRLVILLGVAENQAVTVAITTSLVEMRKRIDEEKYQDPTDKATTPEMTQPEMKPMVKGKALSRSTASRFTLDPEVCPHTQEDL